MNFEEDEEEYLKTHHWNRQVKKNNWGFYVVIAVVCFAIAWVMS